MDRTSRRRFLRVGLSVVGLGLVAGCRAVAFPWSPQRIARIGFISANRPSAGSEAFRAGLSELGYLEGQNLIIEWRFAEGRLALLPEQAADLVQLQVDVIVAAATPAAEAAKNATNTIPIVFVGVGDPVQAGLVTSLARPGGNATGTSTVNPELIPKRLELIKETIPGLSRLAMIVDRTNPSSVIAVTPAEAAAQA